MVNPVVDPAILGGYVESPCMGVQDTGSMICSLLVTMKNQTIDLSATSRLIEVVASHALSNKAKQ